MSISPPPPVLAYQTPSLSAGEHVRRWLNLLAPVIGLVLIFALFAFLVPEHRFIRLANLETILRQTTIVGMAALGMTVLMIAGGIDLSIGSAIALTTVVIAAVLKARAVPDEDGILTIPAAMAISWPLVALAAGVAAGTAAGAINGALRNTLNVVPFIITLGTLLIWRGMAKWIAGEQKIDAPETWLNQIVATLPSQYKFLLFAPGVWLMIVLAVLVALMLHFTRFGRHVFAVGSNEQTARLCGIPVGWVKLQVYTIAGFFTALGGVMQFSRLGVGDPTVAVGTELDVIAAVVIGGGSLSGGEGSVLGTIVGALIMNVIRAGCSQMGLPTYIQEIVTGAIIIIAVALDRLRHRKAG